MESEDWESYFRECDENNIYPMRFQIELQKTGIFDILTPEANGGLGLGFVTFLAAWEALLQHGGIASPIWMCQLPRMIYSEGSPEQVAAIRKIVDEGDKIPLCSGYTESSGGSDLNSYSTNYKKVGDKYIINGAKTFTTDAPDAEYVILLARDAETGEKDSLFMIPLKDGRKGISMSPLHGKLGLRTNTLAEIFFEDVEVDVSEILGEEGKAFDYMMSDFNTERLMQPVYHYGYALCAYEEALRYANQREAFGQTIGRFEMVQVMISRMASNIAAMRALLYDTAEAFDKGIIGPAESGICKIFCVNAAFSVLDDAMQIMGGIGIVESSRIARAWRDVRCDRIAGGTTEMIMRTVARTVLKEYR